MAEMGNSADTMMLGTLIALLVIVLAYVLLLRYKVNRLSRNYMMFMRGANGQTLENKLGTEVRRLREMTEKISETVAEQKNLSRVQNSALQNVGFVQYRAFPDSSQRESFSLTLLDGNRSGVTLTALSGRNEARIYAKIVRDGQYTVRPSAEEEESLRQALLRHGIEEHGGDDDGLA